MASLGKAIFAALNDARPIQEMGVTVIPSNAPKRETYPQIIYEVKDAEYDKTYDGNSGVVKREFTARCICKDNYSDATLGYSQCDALAEVVKATLDNQGGTFGDVKVQRFFLNDDTEDTETESDGEQIVYYVRELQFEAWYDDS